jgi:cephalosporin-C deacetylase-like acetyl esterase
MTVSLFKKLIKVLSFITLLNVIFFQLGNSAKKGLQDHKSSASNMHSIVIDDPVILDNLEIADFNFRRVIQLMEGAQEGTAEQYFFGKSAKYDIDVYFFDESKGESILRLTINGHQVGNIMFSENKEVTGLSGSIKEKKISGVDIQKFSKILLKFKDDQGGRCRIEKIVFTVVGNFDGKEQALAKPKTLQAFETPEEQGEARQMLTDFVENHLDSVMNKRQEELGQLKSPAEWEARQEKTREHLDDFFGKFPKKTPLNAKIVGKIERERYTIEKIIYESQPKYYVAANLYIPKNREFPVPGVLITSGHADDGRGFSEYTECCLGLVLKGYVVLAPDAVGQDERSEYVDLSTKNSLVRNGVEQHHYISRPSFLIDWTLSGLRTWDCVRAVDYLVSRTEVDTGKLAVVGNSGGGQMAMLTTAVDKRIKVCAAGHPGGSMENTYLLGQTFIDREIMSLIPPRPLRIIVGDSSGEEPYHRAKLADIRLFYEGLGYKKERAELVLVKGVHNLKQPKREAMYEWVNKWFNKETEGKSESPHQPENLKDLWATRDRSTIISLGGETAQTLNVKRMKKLYKSGSNRDELKDRMAARIRLKIPENRNAPISHTFETVSYRNLSIDKLTYESETGIVIPALLIKPKDQRVENKPVFIYASDQGKPREFVDTLMPFKLANDGFIVLAIDVRGTGETSPTASMPIVNKYTSYTPIQWKHDELAIQSVEFDRTMMGMRVFDMIRAVDFIDSRNDLKGKKIVAMGEGLGGLWASLACIFDSRIKGVAAMGTLPSYKPLITSQYYNVNPGYFWLPGALLDFDIPDLIHLVSPKPNVWIDPVNALDEKLDSVAASWMIKLFPNLRIITQNKRSTTNISNLFIDFLKVKN